MSVLQSNRETLQETRQTLPSSAQIAAAAAHDVGLGPFALTSLIWGTIAGGLCWQFAPETGARAISWALGLWIISNLDLLALAQTVRGLLRLASGSDSDARRPALLVSVMGWGALKLGCLGLFAFVLIRGSLIPSVALMSGLATMIVVPLAGGLWWSQRSLDHA